MILLFDPYANRQWSMSDVRLVNKVADALYAAHENLDLSELSTAIRRTYRPGMVSRSTRNAASARLWM